MECEIERRREGFLYRPAIIYLFTKNASGSTQIDSFEWDETLNSTLIERGVRAVSQDNEGLVSQIVLRSDLQRVEVRHGEGYFNALLLEFVQQTFGALTEIVAIIQKIGTGHPYQRKAYRNAANMVAAAFTKVARTLTNQLRYDPTTGKRILVYALKLYLDERFSVSPGDLLNVGLVQSGQAIPKPEVRKVIIFDANAYRNLTFGLSLNESRAKAKRLRAKEKSAGCAVLAHPIVIWELLSHLVDSTDPGYTHCLHAMVALGEHSSSQLRGTAASISLRMHSQLYAGNYLRVYQWATNKGFKTWGAWSLTSRNTPRTSRTRLPSKTSRSSAWEWKPKKRHGKKACRVYSATFLLRW